MIALLILSCSTTEGPVAALKACDDSECRTGTVEAAYEAAPEDVSLWLHTLSDPVVQAAMLDQLTYRFPEDARTLCTTVPTDQQAKNRCSRRNVRPHLFQNPGGLKRTNISKVNQRSASGPRSSDLPVPASAAAGWEGVVAPVVDCRQQGEALCALNAALEAAKSGEDAAVIAAHCRRGSPDDERAYGECLFKASESVGEHHATAGIPTAMALCSDSIFGPMCVAHLLTRASPPVPAADSFTAADIDAALAAAAAFEQIEYGALYADRFWASWVYTSYSISRTVHGSLLEHLPSEALHHVPVAAAYQQLSKDVPLRLSDAVEALSVALAQRGPMAPVTHRQAVTRMQRHLWEQDWPGEEVFPTTWVMGPSRRVLAADSPTAEFQLAVLEAAAQLPTPPRSAFFFSVLDEPDVDPRVRWTAARIGAALDTEAAAQLTDADDLVAARLSKTNNQRSHPPPPPAADRQPPQSAGAN